MAALKLSVSFPLKGGAAGRRRVDTCKANLGQIQRIDKDVDHPNRIALVDEIIQAFGQQGRLPPIRPRTKRFIGFPPQNLRRIIRRPARFHTARVKCDFGPVLGWSGSPQQVDLVCRA